MERKGSKQLYNKLLFIYTAVIVCVVLALMFYFWNSTRNSYLERNQEYLHRMHEEAVEYVNDCRDISTYLHEELYKSNMEMNDLLHYLTDAPENIRNIVLIHIRSISCLIIMVLKIFQQRHLRRIHH